ncbi:MAG: hypothetical protein CW716_09715 [Candidatus Bathyarchaeum sp.]|nr:MAG: hypothetical protein CW716_09715 [Candidatus Bathyarchaeum sp.]
MRVYAVLSALSTSLFLMMLFSALPVHGEATWSIQTLDDYFSNVGFVEVDSQNNPHIVYNIRDMTNWYSNYEVVEEVRYSRWNGSDWNITTVIQDSVCLDFNLDSNDHPHILYRLKVRPLHENLMYTTWTGSNWFTQIVDPNGEEGSIALDSAGNPHVAYFTDIHLKYAKWNEAKNWDIQIVTVPEPLPHPMRNSMRLELDSKDSAHIMYTTSGESIKYIVENGDKWQVKTTLENFELCDMKLDSKGNPHIVYSENVLFNKQIPVYALWTGEKWQSQNFQIPTSEHSGTYTGAKLAIDSHDCPHIVYHMDTDAYKGDLIYATVTEDNWNFQAINLNKTAGVCDVAVDSNDNPQVIYYGYQEQPPPSRYGRYLNYATVIFPLVSSTVSDSPFPPTIAAVIAGAAVIVATYVWKRKSKLKT